MTETAPIITAKDLNLWYGDFKALKDISLDVGEREITALIGPSGCGKSTFLKTLNRMNDLVPGVRIEGDVRLRGQDIFAREMQLTELRRRVGMVFQNPDNQIVANVVEEDVAFAPENLGVPSDEIRKRVDDALEAVGMTQFVKHAPHLLSGGQKQRLTIARAVVKDPEILILDDSASALDFATDARLRAALRNLQGNKTIFIVSQRTSSIQNADMILVLDDGKIAGQGTHEQLLKSCNIYREIYETQFKKEEA